MRLEVHVEVGGSDLMEGDTGDRALATVLIDAAGAVLAGQLDKAGDRVDLSDANGDPVGYARMVPDWAIGDKVVATTEAGSLVPGVIRSVVERADGFHHVVVAPEWSNQPMPAVYVDQHGFGRNGEPYLGRQR